MLKNGLMVIWVAILLLAGSAFADNSPTLDQVYKVAQAGRLDEAQRMMEQVLKDHPNSAKAHFVVAELSAKQGQMTKAQAELNNAERLKPDLSFANSQAVQDLRNRIAAANHLSPASVNPMSVSQPAASNNFPWGLLLLGAGAIAIIFFFMRSRSPAATMQRSYQPGNYQPGMQNTAPVPMQPNYGGGMGGGMAPMGAAGGGIGSGIMGGLATGAAVGVGIVAGEALAHRFMDGGGHNAAPATPVADTWGNTSSNDMGGNDFGIADNSSWSDNSNVADSSDGGGSDWG